MRCIRQLFFWALVISAGRLFSQNALQIPPVLSGGQIQLNLQTGSVQFFNGQPTATMGVNGNILGPSLILHKGDFVQMHVQNNLDDTTTIHWHGMHVSAENDGGPHTPIAPGTTWEPGFTILDKAATYWYHPHLHKHTDAHVSKGIAGMIIVRDDEEGALNLPRTYGMDEFPLVIQTKDFDADNQIVVHSNNDDVVMVNATLDPYLDVPAQVVRFHVLNGSSQRTFNLGLNDNQTFYQIASDGGLLSEPLPLTRLLLAPGERAELLIDFTGQEGQDHYLMSYASELQNGIYGASSAGMMPMMNLDGYNPNPLNGTDFNILQFHVVAPTANPVTAIPASLVQVTPIPESQANVTRTLTFSPASPGPNQLNGKFLINGQSMDLDVINYTVHLNDTEIWELRNMSAISHPFHIHDVQFYILDRNGVPPPASEQGRKDVVLVRPMETVRFITRFEDFADDAVPYMYHCHLLTHEDDGMMGQFVVKGPDAVQPDAASTPVTVFPNPSSGDFMVRTGGLDVRSSVVFDQLGRQVACTIHPVNGGLQVTIPRPGAYYLKLFSPAQTVIRKLIVQRPF